MRHAISLVLAALLAAPAAGQTLGPVALRSIIVAAPAATADFDIEVDPQENRAGWRIVSILAALTASGTAGNREVEIQVHVGSDVMWTIPANLTQTATQVRVYQWIENCRPGPGSIVTNQCVNIGRQVLPAGARIKSSISGKQTGDQWSTVRLIVEEWGSQ